MAKKKRIVKTPNYKALTVYLYLLMNKLIYNYLTITIFDGSMGQKCEKGVFYGI